MPRGGNVQSGKKECFKMFKCAEARYETNAVVIKLLGDFCYDTVGPVYPFVNDILKKCPDSLIFDLAKVEFIDSKGAGFFIDVKKCGRNDRGVLLAAVPYNILVVLNRLMIAGRFKICKTVAEALEKIPR